MRVTWAGWLCAAVLLAVAGGWAAMGALAEAARAVPVIYCTDLFHPHDDPDDHFDLATLYAMPELDIKGIVLDQGKKQLERPGRIPVSQMNRITGRTVPAVIGLATPLRSPDDKGLDQAPEFQQGVEFIVQTLRASARPVCIATLGSVRDVVAAFNREPGLFRTNVAMVLAFIGEASDPKYQEYNVGLDPQAFVGLMRSGLPVYWVPCFDGGLWQNRGHASFWRASHRALLGTGGPGGHSIFHLRARKGELRPAGISVAPGRAGAAGAAVRRHTESLVRGGPGGHVGAGGCPGRRQMDFSLARERPASHRCGAEAAVRVFRSGSVGERCGGGELRQGARLAQGEAI